MSRHRMDDAAYKSLFSRPGMVRDLLRGFAARDWSGALDFTSLTPLPACYVSRDLRQRHGDLVWRVRFGDERWLYLVLLLEFQSGVDRAMAVRMLTYRRGGAVSAAGGAALARYQPSQQYFLLDEGRVDGGSLPPVLPGVGADRAGDEPGPLAVDGAAGHVDRAVAGAGSTSELTDAFTAWAEQVLLPRPLRAAVFSARLPRLEVVRTMLAETVRAVDRAVGRAADRAGDRTGDRAGDRARDRAGPLPRNARCCVELLRCASSTPPTGGSWPLTLTDVHRPGPSGAGSASGSLSAVLRRNCSPRLADMPSRS